MVSSPHAPPPLSLAWRNIMNPSVLNAATCESERRAHARFAAQVSSSALRATACHSSAPRLHALRHGAPPPAVVVFLLGVSPGILRVLDIARHRHRPTRASLHRMSRNAVLPRHTTTTASSQAKLRFKPITRTTLRRFPSMYLYSGFETTDNLMNHGARAQWYVQCANGTRT